jgi:WhiB family redox-sensing transcriptional regulator
MGVELFFDAEDGGSGRAAQESLAKAVCSDCKVRYNCLEHALSSNEKHGIWGGMTTKERLTYKRRVKRLRKVGE